MLTVVLSSVAIIPKILFKLEGFPKLGIPPHLNNFPKDCLPFDVKETASMQADGVSGSLRMRFV